MRREVYSWLYFINSEYSQPEKVLFEAMSIADRFIEKSASKLTNLFLTASVAYYLAAGFYNTDIAISTLIYHADNLFSEKQFKEKMVQLLQDADYDIIFNHTLRDFQNELYKNMPGDKNRKAIILLEMLEIDEHTFVLSNETKWDLVMQIINNNKSDQDTLIFQYLCTKFKNSSFAITSAYKELCS